MNNQMTEEDTNTLHSMCGAIRADQFCAIEHINTLTDLIRKYGPAQIESFVDQVVAEFEAKEGATK
jgi:hypothetical protein